MRRFLAALAICGILAAPAFAETVVNVWDAKDANASATLATGTYKEAQVTVWSPSGTADGTFTLSYVTASGQWVALKAYSTPVAAKTYRGPVGSQLGFSWTGRTAGTLSVQVVLK